MALALLADHWARAQGGRVFALTVDHGLRPEAAAEAETVRHWMAARGIHHEILRWQGRKPGQGIQAAARAARYQLLTDWCRARGILHLLVAHHADDQAETVRMRELRRSGPTGLRGMAAVAPPPVEGPRWPLVLRPLLGFSRRDLVATLKALDQAWIEDPSNQNPAFTRVALRRRLMEDPGERQRLLDLAAATRATVADMDARLVVEAARMVSLHPAGLAVVERQLFNAVSEELARRFWERLLTTIGGAIYPPRGPALDRLVAAARDPAFSGCTLGGCRITAGPRRLTVSREVAAVSAEVAYESGMVWDGRFTLRGAMPGAAVVRRLGAAGRHSLKPQQGLDPALAKLPASAVMALPALYADEKLIAVPRLALGQAPSLGDDAVTACFTPRRPFFP